MFTERDVTTILTPGALTVGDKIVHKGTCHVVMAIKSWHDNLHGRVYALDLEAAGKMLRISVVEGVRLEGVKGAK